MRPFDQSFPDCADTERLVLRIHDKGMPLPPGQYAFFEWYCGDPGCDCRCALLQVISPERPDEVLATINFGWESKSFYTRWMHGDASAGRNITSASLDPINANSELADAILDAFRAYVRDHSSYPQQLRRHYEMFKAAQCTASSPSAPACKKLMTADEILRQLRHVPKRCDFAPYEAALLAAAAQRDAITPELIAAIDRASADPAYYLKHHHGDWLHLFAIYLLAQFRETRALDSFLRFFSLPGEQALDLTGDMVTENGAAVLASVCGGDPAPLLRLACDETVNEFVRGAAIHGLLVQGIWGERPREAVLASLRDLYSTLPRPGDSYVWAELVGTVSDFNAPELLPQARQAFTDGLVDEGIVGLDDIDPEVPRGPGRFPQPSGEECLQWFSERHAPINAVGECSGWLCFSDEDEMDASWDDDDDFDDEDVVYEPPGDVIDLPPQPYIAPPKIGRNEPCPCGSGKKYKKCCGK